MRGRAPLAAALATAPFLAWADDPADWLIERAAREAGCEPLLTTVDAACEVDTHYACPDGERFVVSLGVDGSQSMELNDQDLNLVYFHDLTSGEGLNRVVSTERPFSFTELLRDGRSEGAYTAEIVMLSPFPRLARVTTAVTLSGEETSIDGVPFALARVEVGVGIGFGGTMAISEGPGLVDRERRLVLLGSATMRFNGAEFPIGADITRVILPGQPGFAPEAAPRSCSGLLSLAHPPQPSHG